MRVKSPKVLRSDPLAAAAEHHSSELKAETARIKTTNPKLVRAVMRNVDKAAKHFAKIVDMVPPHLNAYVADLPENISSVYYPRFHDFSINARAVSHDKFARREIIGYTVGQAIRDLSKALTKERDSNSMAIEIACGIFLGFEFAILSSRDTNAVALKREISLTPTTPAEIIISTFRVNVAPNICTSEQSGTTEEKLTLNSPDIITQRISAYNELHHLHSRGARLETSISSIAINQTLARTAYHLIKNWNAVQQPRWLGRSENEKWKYLQNTIALGISAIFLLESRDAAKEVPRMLLTAPVSTIKERLFGYLLRDSTGLQTTINEIRESMRQQVPISPTTGNLFTQLLLRPSE